MNIADHVTVCGNCRGNVIKARSISGTTMVMDAEPSETGTIAFTELYGKPIAHMLSPGALAAIRGPHRYASHFATCRDAQQRRIA